MSYEISKIEVDEAIPEVRFACDLKACRGACCTMPGANGAPLREDEVEEIERAFPAIRKYLSREHLETIRLGGLVDGPPGDRTTPCYNSRACVFVTYEEGIAKCAFEKAYWKGEIGWRKPLSCHLFPIRVGRTNQLRFEYIPECRPALERGKKENIYVSDFLKDSLTRAYGSSWYAAFKRLCSRHRNGDTLSDPDDV